MKYWQVKAKADNTGELLIYGEICGAKFWDDDVSPSEIKKELDVLGSISELKVYINSPGGNVFAGYAIFNMLKRYPAKKTVYIDGIAASAASIIAMSGDKVVMPRNSMIMIHKPYTTVTGNTDDLIKQADVLERIEASFVQIYHDKTGLDDKTLKDMMAAEKWFSATEAVESKFADELDNANIVAASISGHELNINGLTTDTENYKNFPILKVRSIIDIEGKLTENPKTDPNPKSNAVTADDIKKFIKEYVK